MEIHTSKCQVISITNNVKPINGKYQVHDHILEQVKCSKYLGIYIDSKLAFDTHVDAIVKKANSTRAFLARNIHRCCRKVKQMAYAIYIRPTVNMSLTCCIKNHCTPATLAPAHTPCLFSIDLHTVRQHLAIVHFLLLLLLSGTLFQTMSGVPHHCHHLGLV